MSQIKYFPLEFLTYFLVLSSILKYFLVPGRQVPFLIREGLGPQGPYVNYAYGSRVNTTVFEMVIKWKQEFISKIRFNLLKLRLAFQNMRPILPCLSRNLGEEKRFSNILKQKGGLKTIQGCEQVSIINYTRTKFKLGGKLHEQTAALGLNPVWNSPPRTKNLHPNHI